MTLNELKEKIDQLVADGWGNTDIVYPSAPYGEDDDVNDIIIKDVLPVYIDIKKTVITIC